MRPQSQQKSGRPQPARAGCQAKPGDMPRPVTLPDPPSLGHAVRAKERTQGRSVQYTRDAMAFSQQGNLPVAQMV